MAAKVGRFSEERLKFYYLLLITLNYLDLNRHS